MTWFFFADIVANGLALLAIGIVLFLAWEGVRQRLKQRRKQRDLERKRRERGL